MSLVTCPLCKRDDVHVVEAGGKAGTLAVHYARASDTRPCPGSFGCRVCGDTGYVATEIGERCTCAAGRKAARS